MEKSIKLQGRNLQPYPCDQQVHHPFSDASLSVGMCNPRIDSSPIQMMVQSKNSAPEPKFMKQSMTFNHFTKKPNPKK